MAIRKKTRHKRIKKRYTKSQRKAKKRGSRRRRRKKKSCGCGMQKGGGIELKTQSPAAPNQHRWGGKIKAFPPGNIYKGGVNNGAKFYGYQTGVVKPPRNMDGLIYNRAQKGGRKTRKAGKRYRQRGGDISQFLANNVLGFADMRDIYWKGGEMAKGLYNQYLGFRAPTNTSAYIQPIGKSKALFRDDPIPIAEDLVSASSKAAQYSPQFKKIKTKN